jgi:hypothetical protein
MYTNFWELIFIILLDIIIIIIIIIINNNHFDNNPTSGGKLSPLAMLPEMGPLHQLLIMKMMIDEYWTRPIRTKISEHRIYRSMSKLLSDAFSVLEAT